MLALKIVGCVRLAQDKCEMRGFYQCLLCGNDRFEKERCRRMLNFVGKIH